MSFVCSVAVFRCLLLFVAMFAEARVISAFAAEFLFVLMLLFMLLLHVAAAVLLVLWFVLLLLLLRLLSLWLVLL